MSIDIMNAKRGSEVPVEQEATLSRPGARGGASTYACTAMKTRTAARCTCMIFWARSERYSLPVIWFTLESPDALHEYTGFAPERIVGVGATEIIERLLHGLPEPGDGMITCPPSLPQHNAGASRARITLVQVPLNERFEHTP